MTDLKTLRELAEKASNPWHDDIFHDHHVGVCIARKGCNDESDQCENDAEFMQAASPQNILALLDRYERAVELISRISVEPDCGCVPCRGQCMSDQQRKIELEEVRQLCRDFLKSIEESDL